MSSVGANGLGAESHRQAGIIGKYWETDQNMVAFGLFKGFVQKIKMLLALCQMLLCLWEQKYIKAIIRQTGNPHFLNDNGTCCLLITRQGQGHSRDSSNIHHKTNDLEDLIKMQKRVDISAPIHPSNKQLKKDNLLIAVTFREGTEALSHAWQQLQALTQASFSASTFLHIKQGFVPQ